ncbi:unnamed protein product, partial [Symbiodinium necroappetens]
VVSFVSWAALGLLSWLGHHVEQPRFADLASVDEPIIAYSSLLASFPTPDGQVPRAVLAAMRGKVALDLTTDAAVTRIRSCLCLDRAFWVRGICVKG